MGTSYEHPAVSQSGSPYGPVAITGDDVQVAPGEKNLATAEFLGMRVAEVAKELN